MAGNYGGEKLLNEAAIDVLATVLGIVERLPRGRDFRVDHSVRVGDKGERVILTNLGERDKDPYRTEVVLTPSENGITLTVPGVPGRPGSHRHYKIAGAVKDKPEDWKAGLADAIAVHWGSEGKNMQLAEPEKDTRVLAIGLVQHVLNAIVPQFVPGAEIGHQSTGPGRDFFVPRNARQAWEGHDTIADRDRIAKLILVTSDQGIVSLQLPHPTLPISGVEVQIATQDGLIEPFGLDPTGPETWGMKVLNVIKNAYAGAGIEPVANRSVVEIGEEIAGPTEVGSPHPQRKPGDTAPR